MTIVMVIVASMTFQRGLQFFETHPRRYLIVESQERRDPANELNLFRVNK